MDKDSSENYSSNEDIEFSEEDEYLSSKTHSDSKKSISKKSIENINKKVNIKEDIYKEYYRVSGLNKIKFMIFDFEQEMIVETDNQKKENKSEVENIIINYKLKLPTVMNKDGNDPSIKVNKLLLKYSNKDIPKVKLIRVNSSSSQTQDEQKLKKQK